jgi:hypothetical protein
MGATAEYHCHSDPRLGGAEESAGDVSSLNDRFLSACGGVEMTSGSVNDRL